LERILEQNMKKVWERTLKTSHLKKLGTHFRTKHEKGVGTPFPRIPLTTSQLLTKI